MFECTDNVYLFTAKGKKRLIYKLACSANVKETFVEIFNTPLRPGLNEGADEVDFTSAYQLQCDEVWKIENFESEAVLNTVEDADLLNDYRCRDNEGTSQDGYKIKAVFMAKQVENTMTYVFQKFEQRQVFKQKKLRLFWNDDIFTTFNHFGLTIAENVDCILTGTTLTFVDYNSANKVFDLSRYYREATQEEITSFRDDNHFHVESIQKFEANMKSLTLRKQVARILDNGVLLRHTSSQLRNIAQNNGVTLALNNENKIVFPDDKKQMKTLILFLAEQIYKSPLRDDTFLIASGTREQNID